MTATQWPAAGLIPRSTSLLDETLNRGPYLSIAFMCWLDQTLSINQSIYLTYCMKVFNWNTSRYQYFRYIDSCK